MGRNHKNVVFGLLLFVLISVGLYYRVTDNYKVVNEKLDFSELIGTWAVVHSDFHPKDGEIIFGENRVNLTDFPDLSEFDPRSKISSPRVRFISGEYDASIHVMPSGWAVKIIENDLRIVSRRGRIFLQQFGSVYSDDSIIYSRRETRNES
jgi:hypothetical protein